MLISAVIKRVDALYPNVLTNEEKRAICYDLSSQIRSEAKREYESITLMPGDKPILPEGVSMSDVTAVIKGGRLLRKSDMAILGNSTVSEVTEIIYISHPLPYLELDFSDTVVTDGRLIYFADMPAVQLGTIITLNSGQNAGYIGSIVAIEDECFEMDTDFLHNVTESADGTISPPYRTECSAPYDEMYIDYLIGKILYYSQNFDAANHYLAQFNARYGAYCRYMNEHDSVNRLKMKNYW